MGLCAYYDGEELGVKNSNSFNDQFDILVSSGHIRRGAGSYRAHLPPVLVLRTPRLPVERPPGSMSAGALYSRRSCLISSGTVSGLRARRARAS